MSASDRGAGATGSPSPAGAALDGAGAARDHDPAPGGAPADTGTEPPDLRLAPLVGAVWGAQALVLLAMPTRPLGWAVAAGAALAAVVAGTSVLVRRGGARHPVGFLLVGGVLLGALVAAGHVARLQPPAVTAAVLAEAVVRVEATVTGDPQVRIPDDVPGRPGQPRWSVPARVSTLTMRGRTTSVRVPVLVRGPQVEALQYGATVALAGRAQPAWAAHEHGMELRVVGDVHLRSPPGVAARLTTLIRHSFRAACAGLPPDAAALLLGLAVGDESLVSRELDAAMIRSGLAHLTAVSGANTSLVVGMAMAVVVGLGLGWRARVLVCLGVLCAYGLLVRPEPSVLRASAMGVVALVALSTGGRRRGPPALLASSLVLLLVLPQFALSMGFALSFAATAGLLVVGPPIAGRLGSWALTARTPEPIRAALAVAAAAHLATLPLVVLMGNGASLVALPANVIVTPLVPYATVLGLSAALAAPVVPPVGALLAAAASPATWAIAGVAHAASAMPLGVIDLMAGPGGAVATAAGLGLVALAATRGGRARRRRRWATAVVVCVLLVLGLVRLRPEAWPPAGWLALACDVGQGDALLLRRPGSAEALLVDTGPDAEPVTACLRRVGVQRLTVLLTHFHADHVAGLSAVLDGWPVDTILTTSVPEPPDGACDVLAVAAAAGVTIRPVRAGTQVTAAGIPLAVWWPARRMEQSPANNASVVALASVPTTAGPVRVLLTGDIEPEAQAVLLAGPAPAASIVKVPHHGSVHQDPRFAAWSGATIALISVGRDNGYGHPSPATMDQYRRAGAHLGRTDDHGDVAVLPSGPDLRVVHRR